jgi:hypothetical protein
MNTERSVTGTVYQTIKKFTVGRSGLLRAKCEIKGGDRCDVNFLNTTTSAGVGGISDNSATYISKTKDLTYVSAGDEIEVQIKCVSASTVYLRNLTICADVSPYSNAVVVD